MSDQRHSQPTLTSLGQGCMRVVTCHLHFWQNDWGLLRATTLALGGMDTVQESAHNVNSGEENSPAATAGIRTRDLLITRPVLLTTSSPGSLVTGYLLLMYNAQSALRC